MVAASDRLPRTRGVNCRMAAKLECLQGIIYRHLIDDSNGKTRNVLFLAFFFDSVLQLSKPSYQIVEAPFFARCNWSAACEGQANDEGDFLSANELAVINQSRHI